jgi:hypothetical protein
MELLINSTNYLNNNDNAGSDNNNPLIEKTMNASTNPTSNLAENGNKSKPLLPAVVCPALP